MAELSARLSEVSQEKARLESRNSVLEKVCTPHPTAAKLFLREFSACTLHRQGVQACAALVSSPSLERLMHRVCVGGEAEG